MLANAWLVVIFLMVVAVLVLVAIAAKQYVGPWSQPSWKISKAPTNTVGVGVNPAGLAVSGRYVWVANSNNYGLTGSDSVTVVDAQKNIVVDTILSTGFNQPYSVTIANKMAYVTNSGSTTVSVISTRTREVVSTITGFDGPSGLVVAKCGKVAYVNNYGSSAGVGSGNGTTISVVDLVSNTVTGTITVGLAPAAIALSPNGKYLYTVNYVDGNVGTGTMSVVSLDTNTVIATVTGFSGPYGIAVTPNGRYAYVSNFGSNNFWPIGSTVSVVDLKAYSIVDTINVGMQPADIAITSDGKYALVPLYNTLYAGANFTDLTPGQGTVCVIDICKNKLAPVTFEAGQSPAAIAICGKHAYVANYTSNTLTNITFNP